MQRLDIERRFRFSVTSVTFQNISVIYVLNLKKWSDFFLIQLCSVAMQNQFLHDTHLKATLKDANS